MNPPLVGQVDDALLFEPSRYDWGACDQLAAERIECPNCGASLARDVEGHLDRGSRVDEEPDG
jgi:hypothetical protein